MSSAARGPLHAAYPRQYYGRMNSRLRKIIERAEAWPEPAQEKLVLAALEIEAEQQRSGFYEATPEELGAVDEALEQVRRGEVASPAEIEEAFAKLRRK